MLFRSLGLAAAIATTATASSPPGVAIFFENDGNWTAHGSRPSALYVSTPAASQADAAGVCASYNETLLPCTSFSNFANSFSYQEYLDAIPSTQLLWSSCSSTAAYDLSGAASNTTASSSSLPFLCTNSAPFVDKVDTDYSVFPRANVSYNGTTYQGMRDHMVFRFAGIPFAEPPVDALRFQPAVALNKTAAFVDATTYGAACLQYGYFDGNDYGLSECYCRLELASRNCY